MIENGRLAKGAVLVIGGGLAGCSAALALARQGVPVTLLEAKSRLGGRVGSYTDPVSQQPIDYCQHVGMGCCTYLLQLIDWLDQQQDWARESKLFFYGPDTDQRRTLSALPLLPAPAHLSGWLWGWPGLTFRERIQIARGMLAINRIRLGSASSIEFEEQSAHSWLVAHGQSPAAIKRFWSTIIVSALGEELDRVGVLPMAKVFQDGFLRRRDAYHLLVPKLSLNELFGERMSAALTKVGVDVVLNRPVSRLEWQAGKLHQVHLSDQSIDVSSGRVIVAVPWHVWPDITQHQLIPDEIDSMVRGTASIGASPISGVHTWWDRAWLPTRHAVLVDRLCQWIFPKFEGSSVQGTVHSNASTASAPSLNASLPDATTSEQYYQIVISASRSVPRGEPARVREMIIQDLEDIFPEARSAKLLRLKVVTDPQAVFSVRPGIDQVRPLANKLIAGIGIAGDWTRTGWPATMESAIRSGFEAAAAVAPQ